MTQFKGINHVTLLVKDKQKAFEFYHKVLGFERYEQTKSLWLVAGNQFIHVSDNSGAPIDRGFYHFAVTVAMYKDYVARIFLSGVSIYILDQNGELAVCTEMAQVVAKQQFFVKDIDGNLFEFLGEQNTYFNPIIKTC